ncbi:MAG: HTH domain-containing protein [Candidatus Moranbacteria bacterium]|nr:HTH domain-containing protein [Candidatus Moranbacteria bacterium]
MESFYIQFEKLTGNLMERSQDILRERFGVVDGKAKTLEEIGKKYRITRERVRQIIRSSLKDIQARSKNRFQEVAQVFESTVRARSGIISEADLVAALGKGDAKEVAALSFFLECLSVVRLIKEDRRMKRSYALKGFSVEEWSASMKKVVSVLEEENGAIEKKDLFKKFSQKYPSDGKEQEFFDYIAVSKEVKRNAFGKFGLVFWSDISPKGTREKAYLVMKATNKPLHFREITTLIDEYGLNKNSKKKTHPQTVHNELIKDNRFILVGRGIYALSEWGYAQGTVREVVGEVLRKHASPMQRTDIIKEVLALRQVKKSTIVINLNTFFAKVGKDAYTLKK